MNRGMVKDLIFIPREFQQCLFNLPEMATLMSFKYKNKF